MIKGLRPLAAIALVMAAAIGVAQTYPSSATVYPVDRMTLPCWRLI